MHPKSVPSSFLGEIFLQATSNGYCRFPDIFQGNILELMESLEYVQAYLDNLLCISRSSLKDHLKKLEEVLRRLCNAGLKVNPSEKTTFCALEIEYLGYIVTRDGIKPQSNKVQAILMIQPPTGVKQLGHFLGMVQYYLDLWARRSKMIPPLTSWLESAVRPKSQGPKEPRKCPGIGTRSIKELSITERLLLQEK
jgi:hypothetical protein